MVVFVLNNAFSPNGSANTDSGALVPSTPMILVLSAVLFAALNGGWGRRGSQILLGAFLLLVHVFTGMDLLFKFLADAVCFVAVHAGYKFQDAENRRNQPPATLAGDEQGQQKNCPFCAETIKAEAVKCRFCGSDLSSHKAQSQTASHSDQKQTSAVGKTPPAATQRELAAAVSVDQTSVLQGGDVVFRCIYCDQELVCEKEGIGTPIECPACGETITIPPANAAHN